MPHGIDYLDVQVSVDDAWDIAAYVTGAAILARCHATGSMCADDLKWM
jgi:cytochrome c